MFSFSLTWYYLSKKFNKVLTRWQKHAQKMLTSNWPINFGSLRVARIWFS